MVDAFKARYAQTHAVRQENSLVRNQRLFNTYDRIARRRAKVSLRGNNMDLGCGDGGFSVVCEQRGIASIPVDYPKTDLERDAFLSADKSVDFVTVNAVIEHLSTPANILDESKRVLKDGGLIFIRTPNWQMDAANFYNDPTHVKPYTPISLKRTLELHGFVVLFLEPGLIEKPWVYWQLPNRVKWAMASHLPGGTKSILAMAQSR